MKPDLLLLHGAIGSKDQFSELAGLLGSQFEIYTLNFSGHGGEPIPETGFSIPLFADDVMKFLKEKKIGSVNIFGYSMGGYVGLYLARHFPQCVKSVFTLATKFDWSPEVFERESRMLIPEKIEEKIPDFSRQLKERHAPQDWKVVLNRTAEMMKGLAHSPSLLKEDFEKIDRPVLLGVGERDKMVSTDETKKIHGWIHPSSFLLLKDTVHPIEQVDRELLCTEICRFFLHSGIK